MLLFANDFLRDLRQEQRERERRLQQCIGWNPKMPWAKELNIKAATYSCLRLFEVKPNTLTTPNPNRLQPGEYADSPSGMWSAAPRRGMP